MNTHEHLWSTTSTHDTSEGRVSYQQCTCGAQRILASSVPEPRFVAGTPAGLLAVVEP